MNTLLIIGLIAVTLALGALVFVLIAMLEGYLNFKNKPREKEMEWCPKGHGFFRKQDVIEWSPGFKICPMCWFESMSKVEGKR